MQRLTRAVLFVALAIAAPAAQAQIAQGSTARQKATVLMPDDPGALALQHEVGYAEAIITGDTIYLSGVVAAPAPGENSLSPAIEPAFARIAATLKRARLDWGDVVDLTTYHRHCRPDQ